MSQMHAGDLSKTIQELKKPTGLIGGKNWLRHSGQAQRIDEMFLTGATKREIAQDLFQNGLSKRDLATTMARVQRHIDHVRKEEHMLPLEVDSDGVWQFNLDISKNVSREE